MKAAKNSPRIERSVGQAQPVPLEPTKPANGFERWVLPIIVFLLAIAVYVPSLNNGFVSWDDDHYIYDNRQLVHPHGFNDLWTNTKYSRFKNEGLKDSTHQYYPLLFTMFWAEHQVHHRLNDQFLFSLPAELESSLGKSTLPAALQEAFTEHGVELRYGARSFVVERDRRWVVGRPRMRQSTYFALEDGYGVRKEDGALNVYSSDPAIFVKHDQAWSFHFVSMLMHGITSVVLMGLLRRLGMSVWVSFVAAALFVVHPMNVASVAWATERKNILALLFYVIALRCYLRHRRTGGWLPYLATFVFFQGALFSKTVALTFPLVLFLTDWLIDGRRGFRHLLRRGLPMLAVVAVAFLPWWVLSKGHAWQLPHLLLLVVPLLLVGAVAIAVDRQLHRRLQLKRLAPLLPALIMCAVACSPTILLGNRYLFNTKSEYSVELDGGSLPKELRQRMLKADVLRYTETPTVSVVSPGSKWVITTDKAQRFTLKSSGDELEFYVSRWHPGAVVLRFLPLMLIIAVLFVVDRVGGQRLDIGSLLRIAPLLVMSVLSADTTSYMEDRARPVPLNGPQRPFVASAAAWFYVGKLVVPINQLPIGQLWNPDPIEHERWSPGASPVWWLPVLGVLVVAWLLFRWRRRIPAHLYWGLGFYLITQLPMLGLKNINIFQFSYVHEHYIYNGGIGVLVIFALLLDMLRQRLSPARRGSLIVTGVICAALVAYGIKTVVYSRVWESAETFWLTTLEGNPKCWAGWYNLGNQYNREAEAYRQDGDGAKAEAKAARAQQDQALAKSKTEEYRQHYAKVTERRDKAIKFYKQAIIAKPNLVQAFRTLLELLVTRGRVDEAEPYCGQVERLSPFLANYYRCRIRYAQKEWDEAEAFCESALRYEPNNRNAKAFRDSARKQKARAEQEVSPQSMMP
ncbi:MAG: hypothetical protein GY842_07525 [bacterium]|nr:hypothetical protein [bacterium]